MTRLLIIFIFWLTSVSFAQTYLKFYLNSTQRIVIKEKKIDNTISIKGKIISKIKKSKKTLKLTLNLYNVEIKIYDKEKIIQKDKYDSYTQTYNYEFYQNKNRYEIYEKEEDSNPWSFIKPLIILYSFNGKTEMLSITSPKNILIFSKDKNNTYLFQEKYKELVLSRGLIKFSKENIYFNMNSNIPKNKVEKVSFSIESEIQALLRKTN